MKRRRIGVLLLLIHFNGTMSKKNIVPMVVVQHNHNFKLLVKYFIDLYRLYLLKLLIFVLKEFDPWLAPVAVIDDVIILDLLKSWSHR
jgi:hypothetical protein